MPNTAIGRAWVRTSYHQFHLTADQTWDAMLPPPTNGLVNGERGLVAIATGIHTGGVDVRVEAHSLEPAPDQGPWEDVGETSVVVDGHLYVTAGAGEESVEDVLPNLCAAGPGAYRIRVHARGRIIDYDGSRARSQEAYLVQAWPAPQAADVVLRLDAAYARQLGLDSTPIPPSPIRAAPRPPGPPAPPPTPWSG